MSLNRLRTDFRFGLMTLFGVIAAIGITPFAVYRFVNGQPLAGAVDTGLLISILAGVAYVWRGGNLNRAALVLVAIYTPGCVVIATLLGFPGLIWMFPVVMTNFLLVNRGPALVASGLGIAALVLHGQAFDSMVDRITFLAASSVVSVFAWLFAHRTATQKAQLEALLARDPLTGAYNRRALEQELKMAIEARRRHGAAFGLAMLDLDRFKQINDIQGHEAGDQALINFTTLVQGAIRKLDRLYRIGGEEFVLLLPGANADGLASLCENLRARVATELQSEGQPITVSIGAAELLGHEDAAGWLARADLALYRAKSAGRNRVEVDDGRTPAPAVLQEAG